MNRLPLTMVCTCDLAGQVRGKGFPAQVLEAHRSKGVGWTPTNSMITCFGQIVSTPFGPRNDLMLVPDPATETHVDFGDHGPAEHFFLGDIVHTDGKTPWDLCPRGFLKAALADLEAKAGLRLVAAFEHEFVYSGQPPRLGDSYGLDGVRLAGAFPEVFLYALEMGGVRPETFLPEYGAGQFEVTVEPCGGLEAADRAVRLRELARATAYRLGHRVTFAPIVDRRAVGNGVHIHYSLTDLQGRPASYDPARPFGMSAAIGSFTAGILAHMPALCAVTAPSVMSYERLVPNRWSAAYTNLGYRDREAGVRICPLWEVEGADPARQFNLEYRAADAAACPHLALGMLVRAGLQGLVDALPAPEPTRSDPGTLSPEEAARLGIVRLPQSLDEALQALEADSAASGWMPDDLRTAYLMHKRGEILLLKDFSPDEIVDRYRQAY
ncbi:MAG: glutamine synthetase [Rhodospirillaceae bacterium]|nr:glutamine synthetase [Rhodospirillaceae bacterium]